MRCHADAFDIPNSQDSILTLSSVKNLNHIVNINSRYISSARYLTLIELIVKKERVMSSLIALRRSLIFHSYLVITCNIVYVFEHMHMIFLTQSVMLELDGLLLMIGLEQSTHII